MEKRDQFLLEYYKVAWDNINENRGGLWKVLIPYLGFYAILDYGYGTIGILGVILLLFIINTFIMVVSINLNLWFARNMIIISNIESCFLKKEDYGKLIPQYFYKKENIYFHRLEIWMLVFLFVLCIHILVYILSLIQMEEFILVSITFFISLVITSISYWYHKKRYDAFFKNAPGYLK